jgi:hypothetical protein
MEEDIKESQNKIRSFYEKFKNDKKLQNSLNKYYPIVDTDEKHDEVYRSEESYFDVSMKGKYVEGYGDVLYGLRIRLNDNNGINRIKQIMIESGYDPKEVISDISKRMDYTEISIEFPNIVELIE